MDKERSSKTHDVETVLVDYLSGSEKFEKPPQVKLVLISTNPNDPEVGSRDVAVSAAYQCYSPGRSAIKPRRSEKDSSIADSTLEAGHHTTRQHFYYTWRLDGVTRNVIHDVLHQFPYYNTEQQSQRYTEVKSGAYIIPTELTENQKHFWVESGDFLNQAYFALITELKPHVSERIHAMYPAASWNVARTADRLNTKVDKISLEIARYVLPIAQHSVMDYTLSEIQLLRMWRASQMEHMDAEAKLIIGLMLANAIAYDPTLIPELRQPLPEFKRSFEIGDEYYTSEEHCFFTHRVSHMNNNSLDIRNYLIAAARRSLGNSNGISDKEILDKLLNPSANPYLADTYEVGMLDPFTASLNEVNLSFTTRLSHTADSQRQRHRLTPAATPTLTDNYSGIPDYITPMIIRETPTLQSYYDQYVHQAYQNVEHLIQIGIHPSLALQMLPNAHAYTVYENGTLFNWLHRHKQRLCLLAQEEICFISIDQVEQLLEVLPEAEKAFQAPCGLAHQAGTGHCTEGDRWCGKPIWKKTIQEYRKERLV